MSLLVILMLATDTTYVLRGAGYVLASGAFFAMAGVTVRMAAQDIPLESVVFFRNFFALLALVPWIARDKIKGLRLRTAVPRLHIVRLLAGLSAMYCYYYAITALPLADAVLLHFTGPLFTPLIAFAWFGLAIHRGVLVALIIGFVGVAVIVRPEGMVLDPAALIGAMAGVLGAVSVVAMWRMGNSEPPARIVLYYTAGSLLLSGLPMLWGGALPESRETWTVLAICGALSVLAHICLAKGCTVAPADRTNALSYGSVVFAALIGWGFWGEEPDFDLLAGTILIAISATLVTRRQAETAAR